MTIIVSSIIGVSVKRIALLIHVDVENWTAKRVIIASNGVKASFWLTCQIVLTIRKLQ